MSTELNAYHAYQALAERFAAQIDRKPHNAYYERPATLSLLPDLNGKRVLDAGCGPGKYAEILRERGASVVAFDFSPRMVALAAERLGAGAGVFLADVSQPLALPDAVFDGVLCPLVLEYVRDWRAVMREFHRVLRPGGTLVVSVQHPMGDALYTRTERYFETEIFTALWKGFGGEPTPVSYYRRSLGETINPVLEAGFHLETLLEPLPTAEFQAADPEHYAELVRLPVFLCLRARKGMC